MVKLPSWARHPMLALCPVVAMSLPGCGLTIEQSSRIAATEQSLRRMALSCAESIMQVFDGKLDPDVVINQEVLRGNA